MTLESVVELLLMIGKAAETLNRIQKDEPEVWEEVKKNFNDAKEAFENA